MSNSYDIRFISRKKIDSKLWDNCVNKSPGGSIFAFSWYLDYVCDNWNAIVAGNYDYIMPVVEQNKWGFVYSSMPVLAKYLGIIGPMPVTDDIAKTFISFFLQKYKLARHVFNKTTPLFPSNELSSVSILRTTEIDLICQYDRIYKQYSVNLQQNLENCDLKNYNLVSGVQLIDLLQLHNQSNLNFGLAANFDILKRIRKMGLHALREKSAEIVGAYDSQNKLWASVLFISSHNKVFPVFFAQKRNAEKNYVLDQLIDYFIRKHVEKNLTLSLFNDANKYYSPVEFGGTQTQYTCLEINNFPKPLKSITKKLFQI